MSSPTTRAQNVWETAGSNDFLQLNNAAGANLGGINSLGAGFGALAGGGGAFSSLTSGTNTTAAMVVGTGASLGVSGSGTINSTTLGGATFAAPGAIGGTTPAAGTFTTLIGQTSVGAGVVGTTAGVLNLSGLTSGTATLTAPAVAGTATNPIVSSNAIQVPSGTSFQFANGNQIFDSGSALSVFVGGNTVDQFNTTSTVLVSDGGEVCVGNSSFDTCFSRDSAGVMDFGAGAQTTTGKLQAAGYISKGTTFTSNAGCSETSLTGGATAGSFLSGATSCTTTITMGNSATAANGWACSVWDVTTTADTMKQTASTATTVTFSGTTVSGDKIIFSCLGF